MCVCVFTLTSLVIAPTHYTAPPFILTDLCEYKCSREWKYVDGNLGQLDSIVPFSWQIVALFWADRTNGSYIFRYLFSAIIRIDLNNVLIDIFENILCINLWMNECVNDLVFNNSCHFVIVYWIFTALRMCWTHNLH